MKELKDSYNPTTRDVISKVIREGKPGFLAGLREGTWALFAFPTVKRRTEAVMKRLGGYSDNLNSFFAGVYTSSVPATVTYYLTSAYLVSKITDNLIFSVFTPLAVPVATNLVSLGHEVIRKGREELIEEHNKKQGGLETVL